jgi:hypothetical protein
MYKANNNKDIQVKENKRTKAQTTHIPQLVTIYMYAQNDRPSAAFNMPTVMLGRKRKCGKETLTIVCMYINHNPE